MPLAASARNSGKQWFLKNSMHTARPFHKWHQLKDYNAGFLLIGKGSIIYNVNDCIWIQENKLDCKLEFFWLMSDGGKLSHL